MMERRNFLRLLLGGAAAVAAPTKVYSFLGGIYRPRTTLVYWQGHPVDFVKWFYSPMWKLYERNRGVTLRFK